MKKIIPIIAATIIICIFYWPFFLKNRVPVPLDITTGMYLPWMDLTKDIFPNGGPVKNPLPSDVVSLTLPLRYISINILKAGELPLWNPHILLGTPLLANFQSAILNPINLLYWLPLDFIKVWSIQVILQSFLAFVFFYIYISKYTQSPISRLLGSFLWAFNGFFIIWSQYNTVVYAACVFPLILFAIDNFTNDKRYGFLISISVAFSIFAGNPPVSLILISFSCLYVLFSYYQQIKTILLISLFFLLGIFFSSPQLLPGIDSSKNSIRQYDRVADDAKIKFLPINRLITLLAPDYYGNPSTRNTWRNEPSYDNTTLYIGILPVILIIVSLYSSANYKKINIFKISYIFLLISFLLMIEQPLSSYLGKIEFLGLSSMVFTRFSFIFSFFASVISTLVISGIIKQKIKYSTIIKPNIYIIFALVTIFVSAYIINRLFQSTPHMDYDWISQTATAFRNCIYPLIIASSLLISFLLLKKFKYLSITLIIIVTFFDLFRYFSKYSPFSNTKDFFPKTEVTEYLQNNSFRFARESSQLIPSNMWLMYPHLQTASGYDTTYSQYYGGLISLLNNGSITDRPNRYLEIDKFNSAIFNQLSIDTILVTKKDKIGLLSTEGSINPELNNPQFKLVKDYGKYQLLKNIDALPYIIVSTKLEIVDNPKKLETELQNHNNSLSSYISTSEKIPDKLDSKVKINDISIKTQSIQFSTTSSSTLPSFIRISQNYDNGWQSSIDGQSSKFYRVNYALTGFLLDSGTHQIKLKYQPTIFDISAQVSFFSIIISIVLFIIMTIWKRKEIIK